MNLRKKTLLISLVFGIINLTVLIFILLYLFPALKEASENLTIMELSLSPNNGEQSEQIKEDYGQMEKDMEKVMTLFANSDTPLELIGFWEKTAGEEGLTINILPALVLKYKNDHWDFLGFEITLSGTPVGIQKFIEKIENSEYIFEINNLVIKKNVISQKLDKATTVILLKAYVNKSIQ